MPGCTPGSKPCSLARDALEQPFQQLAFSGSERRAQRLQVLAVEPRDVAQRLVAGARREQTGSQRESYIPIIGWRLRSVRGRSSGFTCAVRVQAQQL